MRYVCGLPGIGALISVALLASGCSERFAFEEIDSSLIGRESPIPIHTLEEAKDEIKEFTGKLKNKAQQQLNTPFVTEGLLALADKNYVKANTNFQRALKYEPRNSFLHVLNALSHQMRGETGDPEQFEMADVGYTLAARMDPGYSQVPYLQGILKFRQQDYAEAQEHFARAAMLEPERPEFLIGLAASSYYLGELDLAYTSIEKALSVAPNNPDVLQPSSIVYASVGQFGKAYASNDALLNVSKMRQRYVRKRIADWARYYDRQDIKSDPVVSQQLAQNLDIFGVPKGGMFDPTDTSNVDPMSRGEDDDSSNTDDTEPLPPVTATPVSPVTAAPLSTQKAVPAQPLTVEAPPAAPVKPAKVVKKTITPKMALIDVAIIRTEEIYKTSKGVNLLNGLNIFFSGNQFLQFKTPMGLGRVRTPLTANDTMTLQLGTAGAGLTYSLNIFNNAYDRNEVIARPTILVEDQKKSTFFSGGTLHVVIEGGVAGSGAMQPINTGVKLEVTPKFLDDSTLDINVFAQRTFLESTLSQVSSTITGTTFATTSKTSISANLTLRYGETMVLSGLSDQEKEIIDDKVPVLGDMPGIQYLFRSQQKTSAKKTVLVLLTPRKASLSYEDGEPMTGPGGRDNSNIGKLEKETSWMRPAPNLRAFVKHLGKYEFFNHFRKGDMQLENWAGEGTISEAIWRTLEYLYIFYGIEKSYESEL